MCWQCCTRRHSNRPPRQLVDLRLETVQRKWVVCVHSPDQPADVAEMHECALLFMCCKRRGFRAHTGACMQRLPNASAVLC